MRRWLAVVVSLVAGAVQAEGLSLPEEGARLPRLAPYQGLVRLPGQDWVVLEVDGRLLVASGNGRFVVDGVLYDLWERRPLQRLEDVRAAVGRLDLARLGVRLDELAPVRFGEAGRPEVVLVVSPGCPRCRGLLKEALALRDRYRFAVLVVSGGSEADGEAVRRLSCLEPERALQALVRGRYEALPEGACGEEALLKRHLAVELLGIDVAPFVIAPDGRVHRGAPPGLAAWLGEGGR